MAELEPKTDSVGRDRLGETIAGRYRLEGILGHGGAGIVFEAMHVLTERRVAVKLVDTSKASEANVTRLMKEARAAVRLSHPNVVEVLDMGQLDDGSVYLALELLRGQSLAERLKGRKRLTLDETLAFALPIMEAVAAAHEAGLVHRDLKPGNIFLHDDGGRIVPKLLDFGVVKSTDPNAVRQTQVGIVLGTPHFMSPEQARGLPDIGPPVDVWAMGVVLYRSLSGFLPFRGKNVPLVLRAITRGTYVPLWEHVPSLPGPVVRVIEDALVVDPERRYATMREFVEALTTAQEGKVVQRPERSMPSTLPLASADLVSGYDDFFGSDEEETPLPSAESLALPEYRETFGAREVAPNRTFGRALYGVVAVAVLAIAGVAVWTGADEWLSSQVAPVVTPIESDTIALARAPQDDDAPAAQPADEAARSAARVEAEAVAKAEAAAKAEAREDAEERAQAEARAAAEAEERAAAEALAEAEKRAVAEALAEAKAATAASRARATDQRDAYMTARAALREAERRAQRQVSSTEAMVRRAQEPADRRTASTAHAASRRDVAAASRAVARCDERALALTKGRPLEARWLAADAAQRAGDTKAEIAALDAIARISEQLAADCAVRASSKAVEAVAAAAPPVDSHEAAPQDDRATATRAYRRAQQLKKRGERKQAIAALSEAIALVPEFVAALNSRGLLRQETGDFAGAIADFDVAHRIEPDNAGVLNNRGYAKLARRDVAGALRDFDAAIARDANNSLFLENRGAARYREGRYRDALADFTRAIELAPNQTSAYRRRAMTSSKLGDHASAQKDFDRVVHARPDDADAHFGRGRARHERGDYEGAIADFTKVIERAPRRSDAFLHRGLAHAKKGDGAAARRDLLQHLELSPDSRHKKTVDRHLATLGG